ncbi:MAG: hypothetical protein HUU21_13865 [Polyangiaceae bacterium]|nr:hypothetical protein [Polyangiaceae bacterium]
MGAAPPIDGPIEVVKNLLMRIAHGPGIFLLSLLVGCGGSQISANDHAAAEPKKKPTTEPAPMIAIEPGEVIELAGEAGSFSAALAAPSGKERFVVIVASSKFDDASSEGPAAYRYRFLDAPASRVSEPKKVECAVPADRWRSIANAAKSAPNDDLSAGPRPNAAPPVKPGATRVFSWRARRGTLSVTARAVAVGESTVVWADQTPHHEAILDAAFVTEFQRDFETLILPRARSVFGGESDIDGDGRIALFFSPMTRIAATVAFFSGCDLTPSGACPGSNQGEVLYLTPPNAIDPPYNTPRAMKEILAHELEHLLHHNRKVVRNGLAHDPDSAYLLEGFGALAQDVLGFQAGNLYVTKAGLDEVGKLSIGALLAEGAEYDRSRDGALRGGAYLFVRWLYDQAGGDAVGNGNAIEDRGGPSLVRALLDAKGSVASEIPRVGGAPLGDLAMDFFTALALSNRGLRVLPCFSYLPAVPDPVTGRQRGADLFASFHGMRMEGVRMQPARDADGDLSPGGVDHLVIEADGRPGPITFTVAVDAAALPRVRVARIE